MDKSIRFIAYIAYSSGPFDSLDYNRAASQAAVTLNKYGLPAATIRPISGLWEGSLESGLVIEVIVSLEEAADYGLVKEAFKAAIAELKEAWNQQAALYAEDSVSTACI